MPKWLLVPQRACGPNATRGLPACRSSLSKPSKNAPYSTPAGNAAPVFRARTMSYREVLDETCRVVRFASHPRSNSNQSQDGKSMTQVHCSSSTDATRNTCQHGLDLLRVPVPEEEASHHQTCDLRVVNFAVRSLFLNEGHLHKQPNTQRPYPQGMCRESWHW